MRRLIAVILILFLPIQPAWSLAQAYAHLDDSSVTLGFHEHHADDAHDHEHDADRFESTDIVFDAQPGHDADGHHDGHAHAVFNMLVTETSILPADHMPHAAPMWRSLAFTSHIPLLFDWPPARA